MPCFLNGVPFSKRDCDAILSRAITFREIMSFTNIEQRRAAIQHLSLYAFLKEFTLLDKSKRKNCLYVTKEPFTVDDHHHSEWLFFLAYECPSTSRLYVSAVDSKEIIDRLDLRAYHLAVQALLVIPHKPHSASKYLRKIRGLLADSAMAWKLSLTLDEYQSMTIEA